MAEFWNENEQGNQAPKQPDIVETASEGLTQEADAQAAQAAVEAVMRTDRGSGLSGEAQDTDSAAPESAQTNNTQAYAGQSEAVPHVAQTNTAQAYAAQAGSGQATGGAQNAQQNSGAYQWNNQGQYRYSAGQQMNTGAGYQNRQGQNAGYGQYTYQRTQNQQSGYSQNPYQGSYSQQQAGGNGYQQQSSYQNQQAAYQQSTQPSSEKKPKKKKERKEKKGTGKRVAVGLLIAAVILAVIGGSYVGIRYAAETWIPNLVAQNTEGLQNSGGGNPAALNKGNTIAGSDTGSVLLLDVSDVAASIMPSVVSITNTLLYTSQSVFGTQQQTASGAGSGVIIGQNDTELLIVTNSHVISGEESTSYTATSIELKVQFVDGTEVDASVKGDDPEMDLAVIAVPLESLSQETKDAIKVAEIGDSDSLQIGNGVIAVGNAMGTGQSLTVGYLSAKDRTITYNGVDHQVLQVDAAINPGNSGGGLFNTAGQLIGINEAKYNSTQAEGMGYAIPITGAEEIITNLMNQETKTSLPADKQGYLGIRGSNVTSALNENYGIPTGILISEVVAGGPASSSDLKAKDIITAINGESVKTMTELQKQLTYLEGGSTVTLTVQRLEDRQYVEKSIDVVLGYKTDAQ